MKKLLAAFVLLLLGFYWRKKSTFPPHIIFIYADDLGWNDVSFHGSPEIQTANIDALARSGILLNNYYGYWVCTPSRAALLTGKNPIRLGLQHYVLRMGEASGLPLEETILPQYLKQFGYSNHIIGKWHLGYMTKEYTPLHRGFDSFFGYWNSGMDYYDHVKYDSTDLETVPYFLGVDLTNGTHSLKNFTGEYITEVFTERAKQIIHLHDPSRPLFLYLAHMSVHIGNNYMPLQAPQKYVNQVRHIIDKNRRIHAGNVLALDDSVGQVVKALEEKGLLKNSIIVFASDNGGDVSRERGGVGSNFPLRGDKYTLWEGGNRVPALIWSPLFNLEQPRISTQLMHVTDWLPTLYNAAGGNPNSLVGLDGLNMWESLKENLPSTRVEMLYNIDPITGTSAIRKGDMKVINGSNHKDSWYNPTVNNCFRGNSERNNCEFKEDSTVRDTLLKSDLWIPTDSDKWRKDASVDCVITPPGNRNECEPGKKPCLFNVTNDPCEYENIAAKYPHIVDDLMHSIYSYAKTAVAPQSKPSDPRANPACHDFSSVSWLDPEHYSECSEYL